jgi:hypothetical protein
LNDQNVRSPPHHGCKGSIEFFRSAYRDGLNFNACNSASKFNLLNNQLLEYGICRIGENSCSAHRGQHIAKKFDQFTVRFGGHHRQARNVPAGSRKAGDESRCKRVACQYSRRSDRATAPP